MCSKTWSKVTFRRHFEVGGMIEMTSWCSVSSGSRLWCKLQATGALTSCSSQWKRCQSFMFQDTSEGLWAFSDNLVLLQGSWISVFSLVHSIHLLVCFFQTYYKKSHKAIKFNTIITNMSYKISFVHVTCCKHQSKLCITFCQLQQKMILLNPRIRPHHWTHAWDTQTDLNNMKVAVKPQRSIPEHPRAAHTHTAQNIYKRK